MRTQVNRDKSILFERQVLVLLTLTKRQTGQFHGYWRVLLFGVLLLLSACNQGPDPTKSDNLENNFNVQEASSMPEKMPTPECIPIEEWITERDKPYGEKIQYLGYSYQYDNSVLRLNSGLSDEDEIAPLRDAGLKLGNPKNNRLPIEVPFTLYLQQKGQPEEAFYFSEQGVTWRDHLYYPRNAVNLITFLKNAYLGNASPIYYFEEDLDFTPEDAQYIVLSRSRQDVTKVLIQDRAKISEIVNALKRLPVQKLDQMGMWPTGSGIHTMGCFILLNDQTKIFVSKIPAYLQINDGEPIPYDFPTCSGNDPYLRDIFAAGDKLPKNDPEGNAFAYIDTIPQLTVTLNGIKNIPAELHSYRYAGNVRLYGSYDFEMDIGGLTQEQIASFQNQSPEKITLPHTIMGEENIYKIPLNEKAVCQLAYTVQGRPVEPLSIAVNSYHDPQYRHPEGGLMYSYRLADHYKFVNQNPLRVDQNAVALPLDSDTRILEVTAQFPEGWVKYFYCYEGSYNLWGNYLNWIDPGKFIFSVQDSNQSVEVPSGHLDIWFSRLKLEPANGRTQRLAIARPFTLTLPFDGFEEMYQFSENGISYYGVPLYANNPDSLQDFYQEISEYAQGDNWIEDVDLYQNLNTLLTS